MLNDVLLYMHFFFLILCSLQKRGPTGTKETIDLAKPTEQLTHSIIYAGGGWSLWTTTVTVPRLHTCIIII